MRQLILIGDSIRMGYEPFVRQSLGGQADVWAPPENCSTSRLVLENLERWVISRQPDIVHINCGLHDLAYKDQTGQPIDHLQVPLDEYADNVRVILTAIRGQTAALVMWATSTPVQEDWHLRQKGFARYAADVVAYNSAASAVARGLGIPINDLYEVIRRGGVEQLLLPDGVHLTAEGYRTAADAVVRMLQPFLAVSA